MSCRHGGCLESSDVKSSPIINKKPLPKIRDSLPCFMFMHDKWPLPPDTRMYEHQCSLRFSIDLDPDVKMTSTSAETQVRRASAAPIYQYIFHVSM